MKPTRAQPGIYILKDMRILIFTDENMHGSSWTCGPCELIGFGCGTLIVDEASAFQGSGHVAC